MKRYSKKRSFKRKSFKKRSFKRRVSRKGGKRMLRKPIKAGTGGFTVETVAFNDMGVNSGAPYTFAFNIRSFPRAAALQAQFKYYRAAKVTWTYEANYNSFTPAVSSSVVAAGPSCPQLYWRMDRLGQNAFQSVAEFQDAGAKPIPMSRKKVISYVPSTRAYVPQPDYNASAAGQTKPMRAQWIATDIKVVSDGSSGDMSGAGGSTESQAFYYGHQAIIDQVVAGGLPSESLVRCVATVHWQFKDPYILTDAGASKATLLTPKA